MSEIVSHEIFSYEIFSQIFKSLRSEFEDEILRRIGSTSRHVFSPYFRECFCEYGEYMLAQTPKYAEMKNLFGRVIFCNLIVDKGSAAAHKSFIAIVCNDLAIEPMHFTPSNLPQSVKITTVTPLRVLESIPHLVRRQQEKLLEERNILGMNLRPHDLDLSIVRRNHWALPLIPWLDAMCRRIASEDITEGQIDIVIALCMYMDVDYTTSRKYTYGYYSIEDENRGPGLESAMTAIYEYCTYKPSSGKQKLHGEYSEFNALKALKMLSKFDLNYFSTDCDLIDIHVAIYTALPDYAGGIQTKTIVQYHTPITEYDSLDMLEMWPYKGPMNLGTFGMSVINYLQKKETLTELGTHEDAKRIRLADFLMKIHEFMTV